MEVYIPGSNWAPEGSGLRIPAPCLRQCRCCHHSSFQDLRRGPGPWERQEFWFPNVPGAPATLGLQREDLPMPFGYIRGLLSSFRSQENNYGDTRHCHEMLPLARSFYSWRFKQDPNNSAHGSPAPKRLLWLRGAWPTRWVHREPSDLGPGWLEEKDPVVKILQAGYLKQIK